MSVRVVARIRPLLDKEQDKDVIVRADGASADKPNTIVKIPSPRNESEDFSFAFNAVYDQGAGQEELYSSEVSPFLKSLFQGLDVTLFAYGVTGTGKTHTMRGGLKLADRGVIPRLLSGVYRRGKKIMKDSTGETTVRVSLSYYEIYNDKVFDLLEPPEKRTAMGLPLRAEASGKTVVVGLSERACDDLKEFEKLYIEANTNRVTAATKLNAHSSRSHAILRVKLTQITGDTIRESTASAIDLAGSEDNRRTDNGKERLVESAAINKSLFVLSQCIDAISRGDKRIPYRESKMTRILSLGQNNGITVMILNLAPIRSYHLDTLSSLNVSSRAKRIEVREIENEVVYKQFPKTAPDSKTLLGRRQPLRPLANADNAHNVHSGNATKAAAEPAKPVKAFSVYTDKAKTVTAAPLPNVLRPSANTGLARRSSHKRPSDQDSTSRLGKIPRPGVLTTKTVTLSEAQIEAMVEKKVSEMLAARTAAEKETALPEPQQPDVEVAVQKRLDALERRIESDDWREDSRSDGLRYLVSARQSKERGDDATALQLYEKALPFFPGQAKLLTKVERLRIKLGVPTPRSPRRRDGKTRRKRRFVSEEDTSYDDAEADVDEKSFVASPILKSRSRKPPRKQPRPSTTDDELVDSGRLTPRSRRLLDVVNSRDLVQIRSLAGFGAKRARDLTDYLEMLDAEDEDASSARIRSLAQLRAVPGMGGKTVERAYEGLAI